MIKQTTCDQPATSQREIRWARIRVVLGGVQMALAAACVMAVLLSGVNTFTLTLVVCAAAATVSSFGLFRWPGYAKRKVEA